MAANATTEPVSAEALELSVQQQVKPKKSVHFKEDLQVLDDANVCGLQIDGGDINTSASSNKEDGRLKWRSASREMAENNSWQSHHGRSAFLQRTEATESGYFSTLSEPARLYTLQRSFHQSARHHRGWSRLRYRVLVAQETYLLHGMHLLLGLFNVTLVLLLLFEAYGTLSLRQVAPITRNASSSSLSLALSPSPSLAASLASSLSFASFIFILILIYIFIIQH